MLCAAAACCSITKFLCPLAMMNTGQKKNATVWRLRVPPASTWLFSAAMKCTGKQDGKTVLTEPIRQTARWFVIKKERWRRRPKMPAEENVTRLLNGPVYGGTDAVSRM